MKSKKAVSIISWLMVIGWMLLIVSFSSDPADISDRKSQAVLERVEPAVEKMEESLKIQIADNGRLHFYVRKNAHMFNYFVLAVLMATCLRMSGVRGYRSYLIAYIVVTLFSAVDEYYQTFIPGRSGEVRDVLVDNVGVVMGLVAGRMLPAISRLKRIF
ncbi:hypothetical protein EAL2_c19140 [Peptoclostridium acidaminophilum DSM 3953]|uniref:VanZ-like domain-containing protein n=1 Tax=Peptoclostridium acidaminophilum DSM 3953 TaxID=1286171 RepID=W8T8L5_PEPAC|nr:VanZ family protein [Peptoclostridium acidaminophilum]AHM57195.1 hypothetical protein EAL2_c19140 [Peptoclostridium acidaminophilum DSM 3953]